MQRTYPLKFQSFRAVPDRNAEPQLATPFTEE